MWIWKLDTRQGVQCRRILAYGNWQNIKAVSLMQVVEQQAKALLNGAVVNQQKGATMKNSRGGFKPEVQPIST